MKRMTAMPGCVLCTILAMGGVSANGADDPPASAALSGRITLLKDRHPDPDAVELIDLASGDSKPLFAATAELAGIRSFIYSPDARQFLMGCGTGENWYANNEIYLGDCSDGSVRRLTTNVVYDGDPVWSGDGKQIAFTRGWGVAGHVHLLDPASGQERALATPGLRITRQPHWLADGKLLVVGFDKKDTRVIAQLDPATNEAMELLKGRTDYLTVSPDGSRFACIVERSLGTQIPGAEIHAVSIYNLKTQELSPINDPGNLAGSSVCPVWSRDGKQLAWIRNDPAMNSCSVMIYDVAREQGRAIRVLPKEECPGGGSLVWAPDGKYLVCITCDSQRRRYDLRAIAVSDGSVRQILHSKQQMQCLAWRAGSAE